MITPTSPHAGGHKGLKGRSHIVNKLICTHSQEPLANQPTVTPLPHFHCTTNTAKRTTSMPRHAWCTLLGTEVRSAQDDTHSLFTFQFTRGQQILTLVQHYTSTVERAGSRAPLLAGTRIHCKIKKKCTIENGTWISVSILLFTDRKGNVYVPSHAVASPFHSSLLN